MSMTEMLREKVYVLGPLELSPGQFAVGETTYSAIKGRWPYYNDMRQKLYLEGKKEIADAIGNLEARAKAVEAKLDEKSAKLRATEMKLREANKMCEGLQKVRGNLIAELEKLKKAKRPRGKKVKEASDDKLDTGLDSSVDRKEAAVAGTGGDGERGSGAGGEGCPEAA